MKKHFLFVHGGPGLNAAADQAFLEEPITKRGHSITFWNEPRAFHSGNPYREMTDDLNQTISKQDGPVNLIGHSFGSKLCLDALRNNDEKIASVCFLSPSVDMRKADKNILDISMPLLEEGNPEAAEKLKELLPLLSEKVDQNKLEALSIAIQSGYFIKYFVQPENFEKYFRYLQDDNAFRLDAYLKIRPSVDNTIPPVPSKKAIAFFGDEDVVCTFENESEAIKKVLPDTKMIKVENVAHYPHVESRDFLMEQLFNFIEE